MKFPVWIPLVVALHAGAARFGLRRHEGQSAIVLNLGKVVRTDVGPGLHFKCPLVESARVFDRRLQVLDANPERYLTSDKQDISVDFFAIGRIDDVRTFYRATGGDEEVAVQRLAPIIKNALTQRDQFAHAAAGRLGRSRAGRRTSSSAAINRGAAHARRADRRHPHQAHRPARRQRT